VKENFIEVEGLSIRYLEEGGGPPVLLLHGASLGSSADVWTGNLSGLAAHGLRVIACDQPGFGLSDNPGDPSVAYRTRFVGFNGCAAASKGASRRPFSVWAHRREARARAWRARVPDRRARHGKPAATSARSRKVGRRGGRRRRGRRTYAGGNPQAPGGNVFDRTLITPAALQTRHRMSTGKNFRAFLERARARDGKKESKPESKPLWQRLNEVQAPLRMIYGKEDRGHAAERAALAIELNPGLDLHLLRRCKHLVQWDAAEEFAALCGSFLAEETTGNR